MGVGAMLTINGTQMLKNQSFYYEYNAILGSSQLDSLDIEVHNPAIAQVNEAFKEGAEFKLGKFITCQATQVGYESDTVNKVLKVNATAVFVALKKPYNASEKSLTLGELLRKVASSLDLTLTDKLGSVSGNLMKHNTLIPFTPRTATLRDYLTDVMSMNRADWCIREGTLLAFTKDELWKQRDRVVLDNVFSDSGLSIVTHTPQYQLRVGDLVMVGKQEPRLITAVKHTPINTVLTLEM